jgi:diaminopimelate decarboxylase
MKKLAGNPYLKVKQEEIFIDSVPLDFLLRVYDTPLMIFIENRIKDNIKRFNGVFSEIFDNYQGFYSVKANFLPSINKVISKEKIGAELISLPELALALNAEYSPKNIIVGGPYLSNQLIKKCMNHSIKELVVYNLKDLKFIDKYAKKFNIYQDICLRINSMKYESKLGVRINSENSKKIKQILDQCSNIRISTILSHYGSQMNHPNQYLNNAKLLINALKTLKHDGIYINNINFGGGFPEATVMPEEQLQIIGKGIKKKLEKNRIEYENVYFEPGRYIVGDAALFIAKIIKKTKDRWIILNIGNHICPKFARCSLRFYNASQIEKAHKYKTSIAGIIPTDQDVLAKDYFFTNQIHIEDHVLITNVGAYCLTFSNRFPYRLPKILLIKDDKYKEIFNQKEDIDFSIY